MERTKTQITLDDVLQFPEDEWLEVVNGAIVRQDMAAAGFVHVFYIGNLFRILDPFTRQRKLGYVLTDGLSYVLDVDEHGVPHTRLPDLSFIRRGRFPRGFDYSRPFPGAPDLAVEVVSPSEQAGDIEAKVHDYLNYGSEQVWVLYPGVRVLYQHFNSSPGSPRRYSDQELIDASALFPGLSLPLAELLRLPDEDE